MRITIGQRLRPFSHLPGTFVWLPGTTIRMQLFPTRIVYDDLSGAFPQRIKELDFSRTGPVKDFTVQQDVERGEVVVWGHSKEGYFKFEDLGQRTEGLERLSLGSHKAQDLEQMQRRLDFKELFPIWFQLGQMVPPLEARPFEGSLQLLEPCAKAIVSGHPETIIEPFEALYRAGFEGLFAPRLNDEEHQGLGVRPASNKSASPLWLLVKGSELIRSLFVQQEDHHVSLLPALPPQFHSGRMIGVKLPGIGLLDLEWSKKEVRRCVIRSSESVSFNLTSKHHKSFRINKQERHSTGSVLQLSPGEWRLDQFRNNLSS